MIFYLSDKRNIFIQFQYKYSAANNLRELQTRREAQNKRAH